MKETYRQLCTWRFESHQQEGITPSVPYNNFRSILLHRLSFLYITVMAGI